MVRNAYQGNGSEYEILLKAFDRENEVFKKRVGKDRVMATYHSRVRARNHVAAFIKSFYKRTDMSMLEITPDFIKEFAAYLSTEAGLHNGTIWEHCIGSGTYHSEDVAYLLKRIEERTAYIRPASFSFGRQHSDNQPYLGLRVGELSSPALIAYLQERGINIGLAKRECRELRFMNADKPYFAIGFPNMAGGYEVRNRYFKGCVAP